MEKAKGKKEARVEPPQRSRCGGGSPEVTQDAELLVFSFCHGEEKQDLLPGKESRENFTKSDASNKILGLLKWKA